MYNAVIFSEFDKDLLNSISTFGGALAGASIAGYFSIKVFNKGLQNEYDKKNTELIISKVLYLSDYLDFSKRLYFQLKQFDLEWIEKIQNNKGQDHSSQKDRNQIRDCNLIVELCQQKQSILLYYLEDAQNKIDKLSYNHITDIEFRIFIKNHQSLLGQLIDYLELVNGYERIKTYGIEYWSVMDLISSVQRYLADYDHIERYFYEHK